MGEEIFPEEADGVIMLLNIERLSRRKDTLGDIFHDLLIPGNEEQKLVDKFTEENRVSDIKFMFFGGILWKELQKDLNFH